MTTPAVTVKDLITWLQTQNQDAEVEVVKHSTSTGGMAYYSQGGEAMTVPLSLDPVDGLWEYTDWREYSKYDWMTPDHPCYDKCTLTLGVLGA